ncbi:hypothetical protein NEUTE2DRAFT_142449, partial [Neurospora tetrasperma FGSC 2509]
MGHQTTIAPQYTGTGFWELSVCSDPYKAMTDTTVFVPHYYAVGIKQTPTITHTTHFLYTTPTRSTVDFFFCFCFITTD